MNPIITDSAGFIDPHLRKRLVVAGALIPSWQPDATLQVLARNFPLQ